MIVRRLPMLVLSVIAVVVIVVAARNTVQPASAVFSNVVAPWMPAVPPPGGLTATWFCPGVPAGGADGAGGVVRVVNTGEAEMAGRITVFGVAGDPVTESMAVAKFSFQEFDLDALVDSPYAAAFVEIDGGGGLVEQRAESGTDLSIAACANTPSNEWYFAAADTLGDSVSQLVLSNPNEDAAIVDITVSTSAGIRRPQSLQNYPVPPRSVRIVSVNGVRADETEVGLSVVASRGDVVVGRSQTYATEERTGYAMTLGAPALRNQWWFASGVNDPAVAVTYSVYNPNDSDVEMIPVLLGFPVDAEFVPPEPFVVPGGDVGVFSLDDVAGLPEGIVSAVFASSDPDLRVVVERTITQTIEGVRTTSVTGGATPRFADGYVANTWYAGIGADEATTQGLVVYNNTATDAVVTVQAITPAGVVNVDSLASIPLGSSRAIAIDLTDEALLGHPLIIRSTSQVFVERVMPREPGAQGRVSVWAVPANV